MGERVHGVANWDAEGESYVEGREGYMGACEGGMGLMCIHACMLVDLYADTLHFILFFFPSPSGYCPADEWSSYVRTSKCNAYSSVSVQV